MKTFAEQYGGQSGDFAPGFHVAKAIPAAWKLLWADNLKQRAAGNDFRGRTYYLTARDVEEQVRVFASEQYNGNPWGSSGRGYGGYCSGVRIHGNLQSQVRDWLLGNTQIIGHNFGRGHISGMRFRPVGEPLGPSETATITKKIRIETLRLGDKKVKVRITTVECVPKGKQHG